MSDSEHRSDQGRFGPPPVMGLSMTAYREGPRWHLVVSSRREGQKFERTLTLDELPTGDLVEALVVEAYRLLR